MTVFHPKVSIIIPVYNGSKYMRGAIDSALNQTYDNVEVIVVNDASDDEGESAKIARSYGDRIRYFENAVNGGVSTALNLGIEKMTGDYFSWLSHDDYYYHDKVERQIEFLKDREDKNVFLYGNYSLLQDGLITPITHNHVMLTRKPRYSLLRGCVNGLTVLLPKSIIDDIGEFNADLRTMQDYDYWRRVGAKYDFVHMEDFLAITRLHAEQGTKVSPAVFSEGNPLWIEMIEDLPDAEKIRYEGTLYNYYREMARFLEQTPYSGALEFCRERMEVLDAELRATPFNPKVSIIIPFHNRVEQTLVALDSALRQTYPNIEVLLIDDGSDTDIGPLSAVALAHDNVEIITLGQNLGPAVARNTGIDRASGEYVAFLDSDDEFLPSKIEVQIEAMKRFNPNFSYTAYTRRTEDGDTYMCSPHLTGLVMPQLIAGAPIATPTVMIRKSFLDEHDLRFNEQMRTGEDTCLWLDCAKYSDILLVEEALTVVNVGSQNTVNDAPRYVEGIKDITTYVLNDPYLRRFSDEVSALCRYLDYSNNEANKEADARAMFGGPVVSGVRSSGSSNADRIKRSLPYRLLRAVACNSPVYNLRRIVHEVSKLFGRQP